MSRFKRKKSGEEPVTIADYRRITGDNKSTDEQAQKNINTLKFFAEITIDIVNEEVRRKRLLEASPGGFQFDETGYTCKICDRGASGENSWYDKYGLKCMNCQTAINKKIISGWVATKRESWYSKTEMEVDFNMKGHLLKKYIKQGILKDRIILNAEKQQHLQLFLIKDNRNFLPPKQLLQSRTVKVMRDGEEWYTSERWYEYIDENLAKKLSKYKIVECFNESFSKPISAGRFYHKGINPLFTYKY